jgi:type II secretory pathway component GspD/PulD (secretin)
VLLVAAAWAAPSSAPAQFGDMPVQARAPRAREAMKSAQNAYRRGEYEVAAMFYRDADQFKDQLRPDEQADLAAQMRLNDAALKGSRDGSDHLRKAADLLDQGKIQEAGAIVKGESVNQYLKAQDKALLGQLSERLRAKSYTGLPAGLGKNANVPDMSKEDYTTIVKSARSALDRGDLDLADGLAKQAERKGKPFTVPFWSDDHNKVIADIHTAHIKIAAAKAAQRENGIDPDQPSMMASATTTVKGLFTPVGKGAVPASPDAKPSPDATSQGARPVSKDTLEARKLIAQGYDALNRNDYVQAKKCAEMAKAKIDPNAWWEAPTPDQLLSEIQIRQGQVVQASLASGEPKAKSTTSSVFVDAGNARKVLKDARAQFTQGQLEEADRLCEQVAAVKVSWGLFEDNPDKLRNEINTARQKSDKIESVKLLTEARSLLAAGKYEDARVKAWTAKRLHGPYNVMELGDRPDKVLADVDAAEAKAKRLGADKTGIAHGSGQTSSGASYPAGPKVASDDPVSPVSMSAMSARQRAQAQLEEARALQKQGRLEEAQAKAIEARAAAAEATKGGVGFGVNEETPDLVLLAVAAQAKNRVKVLVEAADASSQAAAADAVALKKASDNLIEAQRLAMVFQLDTASIDTKLGLVNQRMGTPATIAQTVHEDVALDNHGSQLLLDAKEEIAKARYKEARKLAEMAFDPKYGVQKQAEMVLRSIDIEELEQKRLDTDRAFTSAVVAYNNKNFAQAQAIVANLDERLLNDANKSRLREMAITPEMAPRGAPLAIQLTSSQIQMPNGPGLSNATDAPSMPSPVSNEGDFGNYRAMSAVELDMWTKQSLAAQKAASERAKANDVDGAIEVLQAFTARLAESHLDPQQMADLRRAVDRYMQQYQMLNAQIAFEKNRNANLLNGRSKEEQRTLHEQELGRQISKLMDQYGQLMREHKYKEANVCALQAKEMDPENTAVQEAVYISTIKAQLDHNEINQANQKKFFMDGLDGNPGPYVDIRSPLKYDPRDKEKLERRVGYTQGIQSALRNPKERLIEQALSERNITLNLKDRPLEQAIADVQSYVGDINIIIDHAALRDAGINLGTPIKQSFSGISLRSALNILLNDAGLTFIIKDECITVTTADKSRGGQKTVTYSVADLVIPVEADHSLLSDVNRAVWQYGINNKLNGGNPQGGPQPFNGPGTLGGGQPVSGPSVNGAGQANTMTGKGPGFKPDKDQTMEELLKRLITSTVAPDTWSDVGGKGTIQYYPMGLALVVNATEDIQEQIQELLQALRRLQDLEVAIEMRLVSVSEAFYEKMAVNFNLNILSNANPSAAQQLLSGVFSPNGQVNQFRPNGMFVGLTPAGTYTPDLGLPISTSSYSFSTPPFGGYPGTLGADGGLSIGLAFLSDIQVFMMLDAAQGDRRTNTMQAPKITVFNGQTATISVGDQLYFMDQINVVQINGQSVFQPVQNPQFYGVNMTVTPVVSADRRFVRLNLNPSLQNLVSATVPLLPVQQIVPQLFYDNISPPQPVVFQLFFQQPSTAFITLNTTVVVPDGGTVLMGGLKTLVEGRNETGPPILSKIPYLSRLFKNTAYGREGQSLMIMVTARIIINEEEEKEFLGELPPIPR